MSHPHVFYIQSQVAQEEMDVDKEWVDYLSKRMYDAVMTRIPDVTLNGDVDQRYPGNLNFSFAYVEVWHAPRLARAPFPFFAPFLRAFVASPRLSSRCYRPPRSRRARVKNMEGKSSFCCSAHSSSGGSISLTFSHPPCAPCGDIRRPFK